MLLVFLVSSNLNLIRVASRSKVQCGNHCGFWKRWCFNYVFQSSSEPILYNFVTWSHS